MSHCLGVKCAICEQVIQPDTCPERGCPGGHGWTYTDDHILHRHVTIGDDRP